MSLTFPHSRACLPTSLAHVFLPTSLFAPPSSISVFPALLAHKPLGPLCIRAAFLPCHSRSFWCREGFPYHPTEFRTFGLLLAPLPYSSHAVPHTELLFQLLGVTKLISHLFPFFSPPLGNKQWCSSLMPPSPLPVADLLLLGFLAAAAAAALSRGSGISVSHSYCAALPGGSERGRGVVWVLWCSSQSHGAI